MSHSPDTSSALLPLPGASAGTGGGVSPHSRPVARTVASQIATPVALPTSCGGAVRLPQAFSEHGGTLSQVGHAPAAGSGPSARRSRRGHIKRGLMWLENSLIGDLIGLICLFGGMYLLLIISWAASA